MKNDFITSLEGRRSYYSIGNREIVPISEVTQIIERALYTLPSAFNSQSTRIVLLTGDNHKYLWQIAIDELTKIVDPQQLLQTTQKITNCFAAGYGTILYYENQQVVMDLQKSYPSYAHHFPMWSEQTSGMHQISIWTMLEEMGLGASLQHYNPLIDRAVAQKWNIPLSWRLIAQMPFGNPLAEPGPKSHARIEERFLLY